MMSPVPYGALGNCMTKVMTILNPNQFTEWKAEDKNRAVNQDINQALHQLYISQREEPETDNPWWNSL